MGRYGWCRAMDGAENRGALPGSMSLPGRGLPPLPPRRRRRLAATTWKDDGRRSKLLPVTKAAPPTQKREAPNKDTICLTHYTSWRQRCGQSNIAGAPLSTPSPSADGEVTYYSLAWVGTPALPLAMVHYR